MSRPQPKPGQTWRHYLGGEVMIAAVNPDGLYGETVTTRVGRFEIDKPVSFFLDTLCNSAPVQPGKDYHGRTLYYRYELIRDVE